MIGSPKSLTATVHIRFHYAEPVTKPLVEGETELLGKVLEHAADLNPVLQELLIKFANHLKEQSNGQTSR